MAAEKIALLLDDNQFTQYKYLFVSTLVCMQIHKEHIIITKTFLYLYIPGKKKLILRADN